MYATRSRQVERVLCEALEPREFKVLITKDRASRGAVHHALKCGSLQGGG